MNMQPISNAQVAKLVGVHPVTLERWLTSGKVHQPKLLITGGRIFRLWSPEDVNRLRQYKAAHQRRQFTMNRTARSSKPRGSKVA